MQYGMLGPLEVTDGGRRLDIGPRRQRQLLAVLLVEANRVVSLDRLIDELWGDAPPNAATASIQAYVSNLRRVLEPERGPREPARVLVTEPPGYVLRVGPDQIDAVVCEQMVEQAASYTVLGHVAEASSRLRTALDLWRGEPLADFAFDSFASIEVARLNELRAITQERWVEAQLALDDLSVEVFATLDRLVAADPQRESARALQMTALYRSGRQIEALRVYEDLRRALAEGLGLEPGPQLRGLQHRVLIHDPTLGRPSRPGVAGPPVSGPPVSGLPVSGPPSPMHAVDTEPPQDARSGRGFVGRTEILERLQLLAGEVLDGQSRVALIGGEPGVGKTRLAEELCSRLAGTGTVVAWGRSHDDDGAPPLWPWVQVLRDLGVRVADLDEHERDTLCAVLPELGGADVHAADVTVARFRLYDAVRSVVARAAAERRCVIVLDDLQWADASAVRLLRFLASEAFSGQVLVIGLFHEPPDVTPGSFGATIADLASRPNVDRHALGGLSVTEAAELIGARVTLRDADLAALAERLHARTNGNAFFLTELVGLLGSEHRLDSAALDAVESDIPTVVADVIRRRVQRLPRDAQAALSVAAVIGRDFSLDVLGRAADLDEVRALEAIEAAVITRTVVEVGPGEYRFAHGLVNETLARDVGATRRARLHGRVAEALVADRPGSVTQLAHHYRLAGDRANAARYSELAAGVAERALAFDEAAEHLQVACSADADLWTLAEQVGLLVRLSNALRMSGQPVLGCEASDRALDIAVAAADPALVAHVARSCGEVNLWQVRGYGVVDDRTVSSIERMLAMLGDGEQVNRAQLMVALALGLYYRDDQRTRGLALIRDARDTVRAVAGVDDGALELLAQTLVETLLYLDTEPDPAEALAVLGELVEVHAALIERSRGASLFDGTAVMLRGARVRLSAGDADALGEHVDAGAADAERRHDRVAAAFCAWARASVAFLRGEYDSAEQHAASAYEQHSALGIWGAPETYAFHMVLIRREQGRLLEMAPLVEPLLEQAGAPRAHTMLGLFAVERGDLARIAEIFGDDPVPHRRDFLWLVDICLTAELAAAGRLPCCAELYEMLQPFADRVATMEGTYACLGSVQHYLALVAEAMGDTERAAQHARAAVAVNELIGAVPWTERSRALAGRLRDATGSPGWAHRASAASMPPLPGAGRFQMKPS